MGPYGRRRRKEMRSGGGTRIGQMKPNVAETGETKCRYQPVACFNWANMVPLAQWACGYASQADIKHQTVSFHPVAVEEMLLSESMHGHLPPHYPAIDIQAC